MIRPSLVGIFVHESNVPRAPFILDEGERGAFRTQKFQVCEVLSFPFSFYVLLLSVYSVCLVCPFSFLLSLHERFSFVPHRARVSREHS